MVGSSDSYTRDLLQTSIKEVFQIRSTDWIREWEVKDMEVNVDLSEKYCNSIIKD